MDYIFEPKKDNEKLMYDLTMKLSIDHVMTLDKICFLDNKSKPEIVRLALEEYFIKHKDKYNQKLINKYLKK